MYAGLPLSNEDADMKPIKSLDIELLRTEKNAVEKLAQIEQVKAELKMKIALVSSVAVAGLAIFLALDEFL